TTIPRGGTPSAVERRCISEASIITTGELVMTIEPISILFAIAAFTGAEPANVLTERTSEENSAICAAAATSELIAVMLDPESSQNWYSLPFIRTRIVGVPTAVIRIGSTTSSSGKLVVSLGAPAKALPQSSRSVVMTRSDALSREL